MLSPDCLAEFRSAWLPNFSDSGLDRLIDLLEKDSPLLIHGSFSRAVPMGCLATHAGWHHCETAHLTLDAGLRWLTRVAKLNPATSLVIQAWDERGSHDLALRQGLLEELHAERERRAEHRRGHNRVAALVEA